MTAVVYLYNITIVIGLIALLSWLLIRLNKSEKPVQQHAPIIYNIHTRDPEGRERYRQADEKFKKQYDREWVIYFLTYFVPVILAMISFVAIINLDIGIIFLILTVVSWVISEFAIKLFDIGVKKK